MFDSAENGEEDAPASSNWLLPSSDLQGIWENLVYDTNIKEDLLKFVETSLLLADRNVDNNVISCNRVVLLHGPPGTGKTSLCKALAQKLTIRLSKRYSHGLLIEINSHSLFSKWFSESGKLVLKMFTEIKSHIDDPRALICVLIDEVESLTSARKNSMSGSEPSDAVRVVNALLTQIDSIKHLPNVLILTTSNITGAVDLAFVDRADIKQYVGLPTTGAIYQIYYSCIQELEKKKIVKYDGVPLLSLRSLQVCNFCSGQSTSPSLNLWKVAEASGGLSGRTLRKIPILALALFCSSHDPDRLVGLGQFVEAMRRAVERQFADREDLAKS
jgi:SpoVK/Ycf46/Vps4 family AAA+-type ATPase